MQIFALVPFFFFFSFLLPPFPETLVLHNNFLKPKQSVGAASLPRTTNDADNFFGGADAR